MEDSVAFQNEWNSIQKKDKIYISYDSTNKNCQANVPDSIRELEKIEMIRQVDGVYRLDHAVTATQKTILNAFVIDANYIKKKVKEINDNLNTRVHKVKI